VLGERNAIMAIYGSVAREQQETAGESLADPDREHNRNAKLRVTEKSL
jgi:hypothetical protein